MSWLLPYAGCALAILGLAGLIHNLIEPRAKLSFQIGAASLCWALAAVIGVVLS